MTLLKIYNNIEFGLFRNGEEAIESISLMADAEIPDLIILDINMPLMDGWEFLESLKNTMSSAVPVCMTSSSIDPDDKSRADKHPMVVDFIEKPFDQNRVKKIIDSILA